MSLACNSFPASAIWFTELAAEKLDTSAVWNASSKSALAASRWKSASFCFCLTSSLTLCICASHSSKVASAPALASVTLAGVEASATGSNNTYVVVAAAKSNAVSSGAVVLTADTGAIVTGAASWEYLEAGVITEMIPAVGQVGTAIEIIGVPWSVTACALTPSDPTTD